MASKAQLTRASAHIWGVENGLRLSLKQPLAKSNRKRIEKQADDLAAALEFIKDQMEKVVWATSSN